MARLEQLHAQIAQLEEAIGEQPESARDVHVVRELERLRVLAAEVEEQSRGGQKRAARADDAAGSKAERRQTPHQRSTRIESLTKTRDNSEAVVARTEGQLAAIHSELHDLEAAAANGGSAAVPEDVDRTIQREKIERLRQFAAEKEKQIELAKGRLAQVERRLSELTAETVAKTPSDRSSTATVPADFDTGEESR